MRRRAIFPVLLLALSAQSPDGARKLEQARRLREQNPKAAVAAYEAALASLGAADRTLRPQALLEAGQTALAAERYERAAEWTGEAAAAFHALNDAEHEARAQATAGSAAVYTADYAAALERFQRALELDRGRGDALREINDLSNLATVSFYQGRYVESLDAYQAALQRAEGSSGEPWSKSRVRLLLTNLAVLYEQLGQNEKALGYYRQARAIASQIRPSEEGQLLSNLGTLYRRLGDPVKALEMYQEADRLFDRDPLGDAEIHVLQNVGIAQTLDFRNNPAAIEAFGKALALAEKASNRREMALAHLYRAEAFDRMGRHTDAAHDYGDALQIAREIGARDEEWRALYGMGRSQARSGHNTEALDTFREAIAVIESVRSEMSSGLRAEFLANKRQVYDSAIELMLGDPARDAGALFRMFEQARSRNLQDALRARTDDLTVAALQRALPPGAVLIDYWLGDDRVAALWVTRDASGVVTRAMGRDDPGLLKQFGATAAAARDGGWRPAAERAGRLLLADIQPVASAAHAIIVPDRELQSIPFELLPVASNGPLLIEKMAVSYLPAAALALRPPQRRRAAWPWRRQLAGFGDPAVNDRPALAGDERWQPLPEARRELTSIARQLPGASLLHVGDADQKRALLRVAQTAPLLHLSTHAAVDFTDPDRSRILFSAEPGRHGSEYLFRKEAQALPLGGVDLVTLSACDTESGRQTEGEGIQSFSRAFLSAGARTTVTTLWRVADRQTADFMGIFYDRLARGEGKAAALRAAKLEFLRAGGELALPRYWAAFVLNGEGGAAIPPVLSWGWIVGPALAICAAGIVLRRRIRLLFPTSREESAAAKSAPEP